MALFGIGKKKETSPAVPPDMGMPPPDMGAPPGAPPDQYAAYPQEAYPQEQYPQDAYPEEQYPPGTMEQPAMSAPPPMAQPPSPAADKEKIEEIAEAIVEEKWKEKEKEITKIIEWKDDAVTQLTQLKQQIADLKSSFDSLHKGMLGKISEYDENLTNVGTEIKAMEKVFSKVLPSLTDSVNKMQRMTGTKRK